MRSTVIEECADCKQLNCRFHPASRTAQAVRSGDLNLNGGTGDGVRASYSIESEKLESYLWLMVLSALGMGCVLGVAVCRVFTGSK